LPFDSLHLLRAGNRRQFSFVKTTEDTRPGVIYAACEASGMGISNPRIITFDKSTVDKIVGLYIIRKIATGVNGTASLRSRLCNPADKSVFACATPGQVAETSG
jgi:hypothetical protein